VPRCVQFAPSAQSIHFSKQFKKYMGYTPTQYRKRLLQL